jgi:hypothetical protein
MCDFLFSVMALINARDGAPDFVADAWEKIILKSKLISMTTFWEEYFMGHFLPIQFPFLP